MTDQVSRMEGQTANSEMSLVGYVIGAGVAFIMLPVLPLLVLLWLVYRVGTGGDPGPDATSGYRA